MNLSKGKKCATVISQLCQTPCPSSGEEESQAVAFHGRLALALSMLHRAVVSQSLVSSDPPCPTQREEEPHAVIG